MIIYKLTNIINGKEYVGQTIFTLDERWKEHVAESKLKRSNDRLLCKALRKYGTENFGIKVQSIYNSIKNGYACRLPKQNKKIHFELVK